MIWVIVVSVVLLLLIGLLLLPIAVEVNTDAGVYQVRLKGLAKIRLLPGPEVWKVRICLGRWKKEVEVFGTKEHKEEQVKKARKRTWKTRPATIWRKFRHLMGSFRVLRFRLILDTDDYILNAFLFPFFTLVSRKDRSVVVNFTGRNSLDFLAVNRVWRVIWSLIH